MSNLLLLVKGARLLKGTEGDFLSRFKGLSLLTLLYILLKDYKGSYFGFLVNFTLF